MLPIGTKPFSELSGLEPGQWKVNPNKGIINLTEDAMKNIINPDPIEKWYIIDPEAIARGQFATVYRCHHRISGDEFAAKFSSRWRLGVDCSSDLVHEVAVCALLRQAQRVVRLVEVFSTESELVLVLEYAPGGDLQTILDEDLVPYERNVICFLRQLLDGLVCIHDKNIVHLDIKPQNLVLMGEFPDCCVKLCDFEISRVITPGYEVREILGTADYVAPEIIHYEPITTKTDMWSFGVLSYVLLTGFLPFGGDSDQETFLEITRGELDFPEELFEDISEHAIDFIKRLLIRQPHLRMSAKECLEHAWMQAEKKMQKMPPQTLFLNTLNSSTQPHSSVDTNLNTKQQNSAFNQQQFLASNKNSSNQSSKNLNEMEISLQKAFDILESSSCISNGCTPKATTPINITPTILTPINSSPRDNGLPPLHPYMSLRACPSTHSSTSSLNRGGSRQSLDRLRSISKSREVLAERLQNSSQKKALSRSRERLFDGRYGLSYSSGDGLFEQRSFSHSVERLPPFDWLTNDESIYNSYTSVNGTMLPLINMLPMLEENNINNRLYRSMASIDRLNEPSNANRNYSYKSKRIDSRFSIKDEDYGKIVSHYETINSKREAPSKNKDSRNKEKQRKQSIKNNNQIDRKRVKSPTVERVPSRNRFEITKQASVPEVNRKEKPKKDPQKRRKDKEKSKQTKGKQQKSILGEIKATKGKEFSFQKGSTIPRKGSVSHIEQRIQERHERIQEKQENLEKNTKKLVKQSKSLPNPGNENSKSDENHPRRNSRSREQKTKRNKNNTVAKPEINCRKDPLSSIDGSSCSSLESVKECNNNKVPQYINGKKSPTLNDNNSKVSKGKDIKISPHKEISKDDQELDKLPLLKATNLTTKDIDIFVTLDEPVDDGIFSRSNSMDSSTSVGSGSTIIAEDSTLTDILESTLQNMNIEEVNQRNKSKQENVNDIKGNKITVNVSNSFLSAPTSDRNNSKINEHSCSKNELQGTETQSEILTIIKEEEEDGTFRSLSTSSDIGSMFSVSEGSEAFSEEVSKSRRGSETPPELSSRSRSFSIQSQQTPSFFPFKLSRSNSIHLDTPVTGMPRPWGEVCNGAVNRAFQMFSQKSADISLVGRKSSDPTSDRP